MSPKDNVPETSSFWFVVMAKSCLIVTSVVGSFGVVGSGLDVTWHSKVTSEFEQRYAVDWWLTSESPAQDVQ